MGYKTLINKPLIKILGIAVTSMLLVFTVTDVSAKGLSSWDKKFNNSKGRFARFKVLKQFNREAVLDNETQLVWQRQPATTISDWDSALIKCYRLKLGERLGWRAPTITELASLLDSTQANPALPGNHPFIDVQATEYWSATTIPLNDNNAVFGKFAKTVSFSGSGFVTEQDKDSTAELPVLCVRGGQGVDGGM